jgi:hypothetical protein
MLPMPLCVMILLLVALEWLKEGNRKRKDQSIFNSFFLSWLGIRQWQSLVLLFSYSFFSHVVLAQEILYPNTSSTVSNGKDS